MGKHRVGHIVEKPCDLLFQRGSIDSQNGKHPQGVVKTSIFFGMALDVIAYAVLVDEFEPLKRRRMDQLAKHRLFDFHRAVKGGNRLAEQGA